MFTIYQDKHNSRNFVVLDSRGYGPRNWETGIPAAVANFHEVGAATNLSHMVSSFNEIATVKYLTNIERDYPELFI
jgi:hypothetical protein